MNKMKKIIISVVILSIIGVGVYLKSSGNNEKKATSVEVASIKKDKIVQKVNATGIVQPKTSINISADVSAKITNLYVVEGEWVDKGKLLVEIDSEKYLASVESQEANVLSSEANAKLVKANLEQSKRVVVRARELFSKKLDSQANLDATESAYQVELSRYESSLQQVEQAKGILKRAKDDLSKTTIYAPMSGTISKLNKETGEIAIGSQFQEDVIMTIANLNEMEVLVDVDENDIIAIKLGQVTEIDVDALLGTAIEGTVTEIATSAKVAANGAANQKTEFEVTITIITKHENLRPGMTASADITTDTRDDALSVPIQAVTVRTVAQLTKDTNFTSKDYEAGPDGFVEVVFIIKDEKATAKQVTTGIQSDELIEIVSGVVEGESVVIGSYRAISRDLKNGEKVSVDKGNKKSGDE